MDYQQIERVYFDSKVFFARESTPKEKELFPDKKEGGFFTFGLESGQILVAHFAQEGVGLRTKRNVLTFRPLNHVIKGLKEVCYKIPVHFIGDVLLGPEETFRFEESLPKKDRESFMDILAMGRLGEIDADHPDDPRFLCKARQVAHNYFKMIQASNRYQRTLIPEAKTVAASIQKNKQKSSR